MATAPTPAASAVEAPAPARPLTLSEAPLAYVDEDTVGLDFGTVVTALDYLREDLAAMTHDVPADEEWALFNHMRVKAQAIAEIALALRCHLSGRWVAERRAQQAETKEGTE